MKPLHRALKPVLAIAGIFALSILLSQCSDDPSAPSASRITIQSGDGQQSLKGTELPAPLVVAVETAEGTPAEDVTISFRVIAGGGTVSSASVMSSKKGFASTRLTLGAQLGTNLVRASIEGPDGSESVVFRAMSSNFYCEEANDSLKVCEGCPDQYGLEGRLFLVTSKSDLFANTSAGIVRVDPFAEVAADFEEIPSELFITPTIFDAAFSPRGDFYISTRKTFQPEIWKVATDGSMVRFASLDVGIDDFAEITMNPHGLLVGCDIKGPFVVGCRDTLLRFPQDALFADGVNNDAVAVDPRRQSDDPLGEDIYFIYKPDSTLKRLPLDSLAVEATGLQTVVQLTRDEAEGARGMVCDDDGTVYILVDTDDTKSIVSVSGGVKTTEVDFFVARGPGDAAGVQRDLALDKPLLFTLDTRNNQILVYNLSGQFNAVFSDSLEQIKLSTVSAFGERVGLDVLK